jgi:intracellular septation protein A
MKFLFDLLPVIVFFIAYKVAGIYAGRMKTSIATAVAITQSPSRRLAGYLCADGR